MAFDKTSGVFDFGFLPPNFNGDVQSFMCNSNGQGSFQWIKPPGVTMCFMILMNGGGGGGGGCSGLTTTARGGGGGGALSGTITSLTPAIFLPDVLHIQVGKGCAGGAADTDGSNSGATSYISFGNGITAISAIPNKILTQAGISAAGKGTNATGGAGGVWIQATTIANLGASTTHSIVGISTNGSGAAGAGGAQTGAVGANTTSNWNRGAGGGGAGGAGVNTVNTGFAGGNVNLQAALDFSDGTATPASSIISGGAAGGVAVAGGGNAGVQLWKPFYMTGGSGGGSADLNTGGNGGKGGIGCGGGGGGGGTTGGTGGDGGDGFVVIISW